MKAALLLLALQAGALPIQAESSFFRYLQQAADKGEAESQFILGLAYQDGWDGSVRSGSLAAKWYDLAAETGDQRPVLVLGLLQRQQDRVLKDAPKAARWLNLAAGQGDDYARVILGEMLLEGGGLPADWRTGTEWIRKSADAGFAPAQFRLGLIYLVGDKSTPRNEIEALAWFIVAAEAGSRSAVAFRDERTEALGIEAAHLAVKRSRALAGKGNSIADRGGRRNRAPTLQEN